MGAIGLKRDRLINNVVPVISKGYKRRFVIHRHLGTILHYDLRIEVNGVLKSWAIPKGPSMNPGDRRLAIFTEDKPLSYISFKGAEVQERGDSYMEIWDKGECIPHSVYSSGCSDEDLACQIKEGRVRFTLNGKKLRGVFSLLRIGDSGHWMLIKGNDKFAVTVPYDCEDFIPEKSKITRLVKMANADAEVDHWAGKRSKKERYEW